MKIIENLSNLSNPLTWLDYLYLDNCILPNEDPLHTRARAAFRESMKEVIFTLEDQDWYQYGMRFKGLGQKAYDVARQKGLSHFQAERIKIMHFEKASQQYVGMVHNVVHWNRHGKNIAVMSNQMANLFRHIDLSTSQVKDFEFPRGMKSVYISQPECENVVFDSSSGNHVIKGVWMSMYETEDVRQLVIYVWGAPKWVSDGMDVTFGDEDDDFNLKILANEENYKDQPFVAGWEDTYLTFPLSLNESTDRRLKSEYMGDCSDMSWEDVINKSTTSYYDSMKEDLFGTILELNPTEKVTEEHRSMIDRQFKRYAAQVQDVVKASINMLMYWNQTSSEDFEMHPLEEQRLKRVNDLENTKAKTNKRKKLDTLNRLLERENDKPRWHFMEPKRNSSLESDATRLGRSPRSHIRRGHWRKLRSGKKVLVKPCVVNASKGDTPVNMWKSRLENVR